MDKPETVYAWRPIDNLFGRFFVRSVLFDLDGFRIELVKEDNKAKGLLIDFGGGQVIQG